MIAAFRIQHVRMLKTASKERLPIKTVVRFLEGVLDYVAGGPSNNDLKEALTYFRRWKIWLISEKDFYFFREAPVRTLSKAVHKTPIEASAATPYDDSILRELTGSVSFGTERMREIEVIDQGFVRQMSMFKEVESADNFFRQGMVLKSHEAAMRAIDHAFANRSLDQLHWYFFASALHILGKILLLRSEVEQAHTAFELSLWFKRSLRSQLPPVNLIATESKLHFTQWLLNRKKPLLKSLRSIQSKIEHDATIQAANKSWADNIKVDLLINSAIYRLHRNQPAQAHKDLLTSSKLAKQIGDHIGFIRCSYFMLATEESVAQFEKAVEFAWPKVTLRERQHPYLRALATRGRTTEFRIVDALEASAARVLQAAGCEPFHKEEIHYQRRALRRQTELIVKSVDRRVMDFKVQL